MYVGDELAHCGKSIVIEDGGMWRGARRTDHLSKTIGARPISRSGRYEHTRDDAMMHYYYDSAVRDDSRLVLAVCI